MKYMLMVCRDPSIKLNPEEQAAMEGSVRAWLEELTSRGMHMFGQELRPVSDATTVRVRDARGAAVRRAVRRDQGAHRRLRHDRVRGPGRGAGRRGAASGGQARGDRGAAVLGGMTDGTGNARAAVPEAVTEAFRQEWGRIVAALIGTTGDWDLAEECAQEAFAQALKSWPRDGVPRRPGAWLTTVARNRALDRLRRGAAESAKLREAAALSAGQEPDSGDDESGIPR